MNDPNMNENALANLGNVIDSQLLKLSDISLIQDQFHLGDNPQIQQLALAVI